MRTSSEKIRDRKDNSFGDYLRVARERCSLSLSEAGELIKCSKAHLWAMEQGSSRNPSIVVLANLASVYDLDLGDVARMAAGAAPGTEYRLAIKEWKDAKQKLSSVRAAS